MPDPAGFRPDVRADLWLWSVRLFKTRALAADACKAGRVQRLGHPLKAASALRAGDVVDVTGPSGPRRIRVDKPISRRVGAPAAAICYTDLTDPAVVEAARAARREAAAGRPRGTGRPTKQERRDIDQLRDALHELGYPEGPKP